MLILAGFLPLQIHAQENIPEKIQSMYEKAKILVDEGKVLKAEKQFTKILDRSQHGRSLFQLAKIESDGGSSPGMILPKVITARRLMQEEQVWLERTQENEHELLQVSDLIQEAADLIHNLGGETPEEMMAQENPNFDPDKVELSSGSESFITIDLIDTNQEVKIGINGSIQINNSEYRLFPKDKVSTYFLINEELPDNTRLPSEAELESLLTGLLSCTKGKQFLSNLDWGNRRSIKFISKQMFYDDENNQLVKGFRLKKAGLSLETAEIEPGDTAITILIVTP
jgi:hypothetical protein